MMPVQTIVKEINTWPAMLKRDPKPTRTLMLETKVIIERLNLEAHHLGHKIAIEQAIPRLKALGDDCHRKSKVFNDDGWARAAGDCAWLADRCWELAEWIPRYVAPADRQFVRRFG